VIILSVGVVVSVYGVVVFSSFIDVDLGSETVDVSNLI